VRGDRATLEEAIRKDGWPTLDESRGKILFTLDNGGADKAAYTEGHPSLRGRIMFTSSEPPEAEAAFVKLNGPIEDFDRIQDLVACGYIIRTRADSPDGEMQGRTGDTMQRDAAIASAAQFVSTDYPVPNPDFGSGYQVTIPMGMPARCNPISAPPNCTSLDIENPDLLAVK
jgi:Phosphoinositide phospholipase C, Ca2+-dependent